ncbi:MAG: hypothetical protein ACE5IF_01910 [Candidatus Bathyarchaeia archaeon]
MVRRQNPKAFLKSQSSPNVPNPDSLITVDEAIKMFLTGVFACAFIIIVFYICKK